MQCHLDSEITIKKEVGSFSSCINTIIEEENNPVQYFGICRESHKKCSCDRWQTSWHDFYSRCCQSSCRAAKWGTRATKRLHKRRILLNSNFKNWRTHDSCNRKHALLREPENGNMQTKLRKKL